MNNTISESMPVSPSYETAQQKAAKRKEELERWREEKRLKLLQAKLKPAPVVDKPTAPVRPSTTTANISIANRKPLYVPPPVRPAVLQVRNPNRPLNHPAIKPTVKSVNVRPVAASNRHQMVITAAQEEMDIEKQGFFSPQVQLKRQIEEQQEDAEEVPKMQELGTPTKKQRDTVEDDEENVSIATTTTTPMAISGRRLTPGSVFDEDEQVVDVSVVVPATPLQFNEVVPATPLLPQRQPAMDTPQQQQQQQHLFTPAQSSSALLPDTPATIRFETEELIPTPKLKRSSPVVAVTEVEGDTYNVNLLLLANDTLVHHLEDCERRRTQECLILRQERDELKYELEATQQRFNSHIRKIDASHHAQLQAALQRIEELTEALEEAEQKCITPNNNNSTKRKRKARN